MTTAVDLERVINGAPLGVRFWDVGTSTPIADALRATAQASPGRAAIPAVVTRTGVHAFPGRAEVGPHTDPSGRCLIMVDDPLGRYLPARLHTPLAAWQLAAPDCAPPVPAAIAPETFVPLFSAPARQIPAGHAAVRADLALPDGTPARWALVVVRPDGGPAAHGLADRSGRVLVLLPWPAPPNGQLAGGSVPFSQQTWRLDIEVRTDPNLPEPPDLCAVLNQPAAQLPAAPAPILRYGSETVLRSPGRATLTVVPTP